MSRSDTVIVGIGASAGGLEAFKTFFRAMPSDSGMAFVLVQHLDPAHPSALVDIVSDCTAMEVSSAEDGAVVKPNHVYVMPPDATLRVEAGVLRLTRPATTVARRVAVNTFLTSLAEAGIEPSVGSVGDSYDNALAETINGLYKAEVIHRRGPWRTFEAVEEIGRADEVGPSFCFGYRCHLARSALGI